MLVNFNAWYLAQTDPVQTAVISAVVALFGALFAGAVAVLIARVQRQTAVRAVEAHERTIYLSLIERRAKWFDYTITNWSVWMTDLEKWINYTRTGAQSIVDPHRSIQDRRLEAGWLFGPEIQHCLELLEDAFATYASQKLGFDVPVQGGAHDPSEISSKQRWKYEHQFLKSVIGLKAELSIKIRPYLYVGDIRANNIPPPP